MLTRFTVKTIPQEAHQATCSFDLVRTIHTQRFKWIGHILRAGPSKLIYQAVVEQHRMGLPGNILMDAPPPLMSVGTNRDGQGQGGLEVHVEEGKITWFICF